MRLWSRVQGWLPLFSVKNNYNFVLYFAAANITANTEGADWFFSSWWEIWVMGSNLGPIISILKNKDSLSYIIAQKNYVYYLLQMNS